MPKTTRNVTSPQSRAALSPDRPTVRGKFLYANGEKLYIRGVTYGPFRPDAAGNVYHKPDQVEKDFSLMAANHINAIRTYHVPPPWMMEAAQRHGIRVMVGLPWESHIAFFEEKERDRQIEARVRADVQKSADYPALLCYSIANEVPASIARWYGRRRIERFLHHLYDVIKAEAPEALVTYVNYPTTEYLQLPFVDFVCFNVYLEFQERLEAYMARLQNIAGDKPLLMGELGLDGLRNGDEAQARSLDWQIRTAFASGCAGAFVFAWTDEWFNAGRDVEDWEFGITRRDREPKPALKAVSAAFAQAPFPETKDSPFVSVVVCTNNGVRTIADCCEGLSQLDYDNYEVIVVNDGSTDETLDIVNGYDFKVISTENRGLGSARNTGLEAAEGDIVAYIDDDAVPDRDWLRYLAIAFSNGDFVGVGGPNISPEGDGPLAQCVANSPGNPTHVLLTDTVAEHIPGCNMAFRASALRAIDGFDPDFRVAGDDVDVCWRLQQQGWQLGFSPAALVWHHRRNSIRAYLKQQLKYGEAEALLERKWPVKYNSFGHLDWSGRLYDNSRYETRFFGRWRIYHGVWGSRYFQSIYEPGRLTFWSMMTAPEWYLVVAGLALLTVLGSIWSPLLTLLPLLILAVVSPLAYAVRRGLNAAFSNSHLRRRQIWQMRLLTAFLSTAQPLARLVGRLLGGLTPWRRHGARLYAFPRRHSWLMWREKYRTPESRLEQLESFLASQGAVSRRGDEFVRWDLELRTGAFGRVRLLQAVEEHGFGRQMIRLRAWPLASPLAMLLTVILALVATAAAVQQVWIVVFLAGLSALFLLLRIVGDCGAATAVCLQAFTYLESEDT